MAGCPPTHGVPITPSRQRTLCSPPGWRRMSPTCPRRWPEPVRSGTRKTSRVCVPLPSLA
eukprot:3387311-Pyramimonas_sp.AAC.1